MAAPVKLRKGRDFPDSLMLDLILHGWESEASRRVPWGALWHSVRWRGRPCSGPASLQAWWLPAEQWLIRRRCWPGWEPTGGLVVEFLLARCRALRPRVKLSQE